MILITILKNTCKVNLAFLLLRHLEKERGGLDSNPVTMVITCRTGVIFCVFQGAGEQRRKARRARGEREARVACEGRIARNSRFASPRFRLCSPFFSDPPLARNSRSPRFRLCSPEIRKKLRLFCRLLW